jgi:hypothetical protein
MQSEKSIPTLIKSKEPFCLDKTLIRKNLAKPDAVMSIPTQQPHCSLVWITKASSLAWLLNL